MGKMRILVLSRGQQHHFTPLKVKYEFEFIESDDWQPSIVRQVLPDLLLTLGCDSYSTHSCIQEARKLGIPSLLLMDGALEWRHQWENPRFGAGDGAAYDQPITTDKVACLGWLSARTLETWGNVGKCEITGLPRFDHYLTDPLPEPSRDTSRPKHILIMTANTPGFTVEQRELVEKGILHLKEFLSSSRDWTPIWRVTKGLDAKLNLIDNYPELKGRPLREVLSLCHAVVSTPSTVLVESMLTGRPTCVLDFANTPHYIPTAWTITSSSQIAPTLKALFHPERSRITLQDEILQNVTETSPSATERVSKLIEEMVRCGREARSAGSRLVFPARMLDLQLGGHAIPSQHFDLEALYPNHPIYSKKDIDLLRLDLIHAQKEIDTLRKELGTRSIGYWVSALGKRTYKSIAKVGRK